MTRRIEPRRSTAWSVACRDASAALAAWYRRDYAVLRFLADRTDTLPCYEAPG